jgi:hypothetical protein
LQFQGPQGGHRASAREGLLARTQPIEDAAEAEQVAACVQLFAAHLFRGHVCRRADDDAAVGQVGIAADSASQAEIEDLDAAGPGFQPDIRRFDVAMDEAVLVGGGQSLGDLPADAQDVGEGQHRLALQPGVEGFALQQRHGQVGDAAVLAYLQDADDVVVLQTGDRLGFAQEAPPRRRTGRQPWPQYLQGDQPQQFGLFGLEDDPHAAGAEDFQDPVGP